MREAAQLIRPVRSIAHRFGGSHAQRDVIDLTLIEAALRAGESATGGGADGGTGRGSAGQPAVGFVSTTRGSISQFDCRPTLNSNSNSS